MDATSIFGIVIFAMMTAFNAIKSANGPDACARDILAHFTK